MSKPNIPGMEHHGAGYRCRVPFAEIDAAAVGEEADARGLSPADVIRGIVRAWRRSREPRPPGGFSTPPVQT